MEALEDYIKPELLITAIALYFMGIALKEAQAVKDKRRNPLLHVSSGE